MDGAAAKMRRIATYTIMLVLVAAGCTNAIDRSMVVGTYRANHNKGVDLLELKADGTYLYHYTAPDGREVRNTNKWEFQYLDGKPKITFFEFSFGLHGYGTPKPGFWLVEVEKPILDNRLRLCIDPDLGYYFIKQNS
jgi:hypothetical protein